MKISPIQFHFQFKPFHFKDRNRLKDFIVQMARKESHLLAEINYIFCSDEYLLELNQSYLNHNTLTDIITFPFSQPSEPIVSDIYISVERVRENALAFNTPFARELHRVIFHGILHLCGYKDKTKEQAQQMRTKEETYLDKYFVPRGTK